MRIILFLLIFLTTTPCFSQTTYSETKFKDSERAEQMALELKEMRGTIGSSQNAVEARNLLMLKEVLDFKLQDAKIATEVEKLKQNREFNQKLLKALNQLDNKKIRNRKNQEVMDILNNAGNRVYNSLAN